MAESFLWIPYYGSNADYAPRIRSVRLGDHYEFRAKDGINNFPLRHNLIFSKARQSEIGEILAFLEARQGIDSFLWTPPYPYDTTGPYTASDARPAYTFLCRTWKHSMEEANADSLSLPFEQDFNPLTEEVPPFIAAPPPTFTNDYTGLPLADRTYTDEDDISVRAHGSVGNRIRFTTNDDPVTALSPFWPNYPNHTAPGVGPDDFLGYIMGTSGFSGTFRARQVSGANWDVLGQEAQLNLIHE